MKKTLLLGVMALGALGVSSCSPIDAVKGDECYACDYVKLKDKTIYETTTTEIMEVKGSDINGDDCYYYFKVGTELEYTAVISDNCNVYVDIYPYLDITNSKITMKASVYYDKTRIKPMAKNYEEITRYYNKELFSNENLVLNFTSEVLEYKKRG